MYVLRGKTMALFLFLLVILTGKMFLVRLQPPFLLLGIDRQVPHQVLFRSSSVVEEGPSQGNVAVTS